MNESILVDIIMHYGHEKQIAKAREELGELDEALQIGSLKHIAEEIADVQIMLKQLEVIFGDDEGIFQKEIQKNIKFKLERTKRRIDDERSGTRS